MRKNGDKNSQTPRQCRNKRRLDRGWRQRIFIQDDTFVSVGATSLGDQNQLNKEREARIPSLPPHDAGMAVEDGGERTLILGKSWYVLLPKLHIRVLPSILRISVCVTDGCEEISCMRPRPVYVSCLQVYHLL